MAVLVVLLIVAGAVLWLYFATKNQATRNSHVAESEPPAYYAASNNDEDMSPAVFWEVQQPFPVKATLHLAYEDSRGQRTDRRVDIREFGSDGVNNYLIGFCHLRGATRMFRPDRIKECIDAETGEVLSDVYAFLRSKYEASPEYARDKFCEEQYDALRILFYVGKADGQLRAAEKTVILNTCHALAPERNLKAAMLDDIFSALAIPTENAFKSAVRRIEGKGADVKSLLMKAAEDVVSTQKTVHPLEQCALDYMRKRLSINAAQEVIT